MLLIVEEKERTNREREKEIEKNCAPNNRGCVPATVTC